MNSKNYKLMALKCFRQRDFKSAKLYFSLAYEKRKSASLLNLIELCDFALSSPDKAMLLLEFYLKHEKTRNINKEFQKLLHLKMHKDLPQKVHQEEYRSLNYKDFLESEAKLGFKQSFENIIFANKLVIDTKEDFLDFLEKLLDNGYEETTLNYIENIHQFFTGNQKFMKIQEKLKGYKDENKSL